MTVNTVNDAPVLNPAGSPTLPTIPKTNNNPAGISILSLIASGGANYITDLESTDPQGIAIYGAPVPAAPGNTPSTAAPRGLPSAPSTRAIPSC
ncbi:MAG: hypothetical protein U0903_03905 [Planctomycetales bacterium]